VRVSAKADYALRAAVELAAAGGGQVKAEALAQAQGIPPKFLENILVELRRSGLAESRRGADGGWRLARPAEEIALADVFRAVEGPLANVRGVLPEETTYAGAAHDLREVWIALRAAMRVVLEQTTLADVVSGELPAEVAELAAPAEARTSREGVRARGADPDDVAAR
jgi:Rrf2 family protein